ncbi:MAG: hypothetical protein WDN06_13045 [Asticcacaulis sp.]
MAAADHVVTETDPFADTVGRIPYRREPSPYVQRIRLMWQTLRTAIIGAMPAPAPPPLDIETYMRRVEDTYVSDAYHSLSIEGYHVSADLIERVRSGAWNPQDDEVARNERNALAARGYWQAFQAVKASVRRVLAGENPGDVANDDHGRLVPANSSSPSVAVGLIKPESLAGYRTSPVYIRGFHARTVEAGSRTRRHVDLLRATGGGRRSSRARSPGAISSMSTSTPTWTETAAQGASS